MQQKTMVVVGLGPVAHRFLEACVARGVSGTHRIVVFGDEIVAIDRAAGTVASVQGVVAPFDELVLATGSYPFVVGGGLVLVALADPPDAAPVG